MGKIDCYENDFESAMLEDTAAYYSRKAASWILEGSCLDCTLKELEAAASAEALDMKTSQEKKRVQKCTQSTRINHQRCSNEKLDLKIGSN